MIPLYLDFEELINEFSLTSEQVQELTEYTVKQAAAELARNWDNQAKQHLHSTRQQYRRSLIVGQLDKNTTYVELVGKFPNMIEQGASAWDMKLRFANSSKVKYNKKGGWYLTVPFRFATPGSIGESSVFSNVLPQQVYGSIRSSVGVTRTQLGGNKSSGGGLRESNLPALFRKPKSRAAFSSIATKTTFDEYQHKSSIYKGIIRSGKLYQSASQSQYVSFRRVSSTSSPLSWIHKGLPARNLGQKALAITRFDLVVDRAVDNYLISLGFNQVK